MKDKPMDNIREIRNRAKAIVRLSYITMYAGGFIQENLEMIERFSKEIGELTKDVRKSIKK